LGVGGRKAKLPTFLLFLVGIQAYGMLGILFGPLVVTLLMSFIDIYREEFAEKWHRDRLREGS
jgi:predicted PurR-regulated permease PerM